MQMQVTVTKVWELYPGKWVFTANEFEGVQCIPPDKCARVKIGDVLQFTGGKASDYWFCDKLEKVANA